MGRNKEKEKMLASVRLILVIAVALVFLTGIDSIQTNKIGGPKRKDTIVEFDPYVSILDTHNRGRYNVTDLVPMVRTIATEFDKVLIDLTADMSPSGGVGDSIFLCASAVATYNQQRDPLLPKVEVWLAVLREIKQINITSMFEFLSKMADEANEIHNGTVTTIVLDRTFFPEGYNITEENWTGYELLKPSTRHYKLGFWGHSKCGAYYYNVLELLRIDIDLQYLGDQDWSRSFLDPCISNKASNSAEVIYWFTASDTHASGKVNMTGLVRKWDAWRKVAYEGVASVLLSKAFDVPYDHQQYFLYGTLHAGTAYRRTVGWWRLKENASFTGTLSYYFEAKNLIAEKFDMEENRTDLTQIKADGKSQSDFVGVIFQVIGTEARSHGTFTEKYMEQFVKLVETKYRKLALYFDNTWGEIEGSLDIFSKSYDLEQKRDVFLLFPSHASLSTQIFNPFNFVGRYSKQTFIFRFDTDEFTVHRNFSRAVLSVVVPKRKGYNFPLQYCTTFPLLPASNKSAILNALNESDVAVFYFAEEEYTISLGARRMFEDRVVQFEECRRFLAKTNEYNNGSGQVELTFLMLHHAISYSINSNPLALYNFVRYWKMVEAWAEETKTTVIMNNADDNRREDDNGKAFLELGWWRAVRRNKEDEMDFIDKETELRLLLPEQVEQPHDTPAPPTLNNILLVSATVLVIVIIIPFVVVIVILRKRLKQKNLSGTELDNFFNGSASDRANEHSNAYPCRDVQCLPYDKSRFEIGPKSFSIDHNKSLGSGEFGLVCASKVEKSPGVFLDAAVKMVNSAKFHKTTLTGLLSEIKVLAYLGKHENLIELVGASTAGLKHGRVFVFLELCPLGSLEKHIRALCPPPTDHLETENGIELTDMHNYANASAQFSHQLDPSLSADLYRWSKEICSGMSFLASKHVVHADLATRNVLLSQEKTAKICDFGLSRRMYNYANYVKQHQEPLPWKWMPPESLRQMVFNEKSDVWAYGITLWEMYSLGDTPYPGLSWAPNFFQMLERGFRMSQPKYVDRNIWSIMEECWRTSSDGRPTFAELLLRFSDISEDVA